MEDGFRKRVEDGESFLGMCEANGKRESGRVRFLGVFSEDGERGVRHAGLAKGWKIERGGECFFF